MFLWLLFLTITTTTAYAISFNTIRNELIPTHAADSRLHQVYRRSAASSSSSNVFNVNDFGGKGDGKDDSQAFLKAWNKACSTASATLVVPKNMNYLLKPITFSGPCKSITLKIYGTIQASTDRSDYNKDTRYWLVFQKVQNFRVEGGGTINGNGNIWWKNSCKINTALPCKGAPTAVTFNQCNNLVVNNIRIQDAQQMHLRFQKCVNVQALNLVVSAPEKSPNTDGIHVTETTNIQIANAVIGTGDDCISIVSGSQKVTAKNIRCGPGHGISIGSLGDGNSNAYVSDVVVDTATLSGTTNGLRIKTYPGGSGIAKNIVFQNVVMNNVKNPIIIDQGYCDKPTTCKDQKSAVQISNVLFNNIKGTSSSVVAITLECSKSYPCQGIKMQDINLVSASSNGKAKASCQNVKLANSGKIVPSCA
ncbi:Polygalacturonase [Thalictrum thalictroides]|uniref:endo-polygalacturonase n=1 Tax=Thalictrum thalictroides TaxID=46969 RepID=A0A7J6W7L9_THATH|nr:Polygalacturonase [Thalictrum thalictroides]